MRLIHTADVHLDAPFAYLPFEKRTVKRQALRAAFSKIIDLTIEHKADLLVIAGDLFNSPNPIPDTVSFAISEIGRLEGKAQVFIVPGNHDHYQSGGVWDSPDWPEHAAIFKTGEWSVKKTVRDGFSVAGIACCKQGLERNVLKDFKDDVPVAIMHGAHKLDFYEGRQSYPFSEAEMEQLAVKYMALGHYHNFSRVGQSPAYYSGSPEGLCFDEEGERAALLVDLIDDSPPKIKELKIGRYQYHQNSLDVTAMAGPTAIEEAIVALGGLEDLMKVKLTGTPPLDIDIDVESMAVHLDERFFYLGIKDGLELPREEAAPSGDITIISKFLERMRAKLADTGDDRERRVINLATRLGLSALQGRLKK